MHTCSTCTETKPAAEFYRRSGTDRPRAKCKSCTVAARRAYRRTDDFKAKQREYHANNRARIRRHRNDYRKRHAHKDAAHRAVERAVKRGELDSPSTHACETCGNVGASNVWHHDSYAPQHRLDVRCFCRPCHILHHRDHSETIVA